MLPAISTPMLVRQSDVGQAVARDLGQLGVIETVNYVNWGDTTTGGEVTIETADDPFYTGTWFPVGVVPWTGPNRQDVVKVSGGYQAIRHRVSSSIIQGTVTTKLVASI